METRSALRPYRGKLRIPHRDRQAQRHRSTGPVADVLARLPDYAAKWAHGMIAKRIGELLP